MITKLTGNKKFGKLEKGFLNGFTEIQKICLDKLEVIDKKLGLEKEQNADCQMKIEELKKKFNEIEKMHIAFTSSEETKGVTEARNQNANKLLQSSNMQTIVPKSIAQTIESQARNNTTNVEKNVNKQVESKPVEAKEETKEKVRFMFTIITCNYSGTLISL